MLRTSRFPDGLEQFAWRTMAHATSKTDLVFLTDRRRSASSFVAALRPGRGRWTGTGAAARAQADRGQAKAAAPKPIQVDDLLRLWERQSSKLKTLDVWIYRIDKNPEWDEEIHYEGRAVFKSPQLAYLDFKKIKTTRNAEGKMVPVADPKDPKKRLTTPQETIICGADEVWQYLYPVKQIFVYPLAKEQRQRALDEGPLPFLFNMKAQEAKDTLQHEDPQPEREILLDPGRTEAQGRPGSLQEGPDHPRYRLSAAGPDRPDLAR